MKTENYKYIASCVLTRDYPELSRKAISYVKSLGIPISRCCVAKYKVKEFEDSVDPSIRDEWKSLPHHLPIENTDTIVSVCHNCTNIIAETIPGVKIISLYELILNDENFIYPDYHNEEMTIQDCWRASDHFEEKKAVRALMKKMNIKIREIKEPEDFCGISLFRPQPPRNPIMAPKHYGPQSTVGKFGTYTAEEQVELMKKHAEKIETDKVVTYCHYCQKGLELSGKESLHIIELLFPTED